MTTSLDICITNFIKLKIHLKNRMTNKENFYDFD